MTQATNPTALYILESSPNKRLADELSATVSRFNYAVWTTSDPRALLKKLQTEPPKISVFFIDQQNQKFVEALAQTVRKVLGKDIKLLSVLCPKNDEFAKKLLEIGCDSTLECPYKIDAILKLIQKLSTTKALDDFFNNVSAKKPAAQAAPSPKSPKKEEAEDICNSLF